MRPLALAGLTLLLAGCGDDPPAGPGGATLRISTTTQGLTRDADGYILRITGRPDTTLTDGTGIELASLPAGRYEVTLAGIARNCATTSPPSRTAELAEGAALTLAFVVACDSAVVDAILYRAFVDGRWQVFGLTPGDTAGRRIADGFDAAVSPDGRRLAIGDAGLFVMDADGSDRRLLSPTNVLGVSWSPDGERIAFGSTPGLSRDYDIRVIRPDGTGDMRVAGSPDPEYGPRWSPDGTRLAYQREVPREPPSWQTDIFVVNADGTGERNMTSDPRDFDELCDWSPAERVLFRSSFFESGRPALLSRLPDDPEVAIVRQELLIDCGVWSPDGQAVAVTTTAGWFYLTDTQGRLLQEPLVLPESAGLLQWVP